MTAAPLVDGAPAPVRVVVIGNGMAGSRLVEELRRRAGADRLAVTVVGAEPHAAYNRILLSSVLAGKVTVDDIELTPRAWCAAHDVDLRTGVAATAVDRAARVVRLSDGTALGYDVLVLATGSRARVPAVTGFTDSAGGLHPAVHVFRTVDDCAAIAAAARAARHVVVVGGGLLGLEAARGLAGLGADVHVLHKGTHLMDRQLDDMAAAVLTRTLQRLRVDVRLRSVPIRYDTTTDPGSIVLADGAHVPADLVVLACGVEPEVTLARDAGLTVERGIVVDDDLRSVEDAGVFAIGECAQHDGTVYGLVAPAWEQAAVLADRLTGELSSYRGSRLVTRLKAADVDLATMGDGHADDDTDAEVVRFLDPTRGTYKKLVIRDGRLTGAILLGDNATVGTVTQLFDRSGVVPSDRVSLLFPGRGATAVESPAHMPDRATVCRCNNVTKRAITQAFLAGARDVPAVAAATRATTGCGGCRDVVCGLVDWLAETDPGPAPDVPPADERSADERSADERSVDERRAGRASVPVGRVEAPVG